MNYNNKDLKYYEKTSNEKKYDIISLCTTNFLIFSLLSIFNFTIYSSSIDNKIFFMFTQTMFFNFILFYNIFFISKIEKLKLEYYEKKYEEALKNTEPEKYIRSQRKMKLQKFMK